MSDEEHRIWVAEPGEAETVARLLSEFRDWMSRDWPSDNSFLASVERLIDQPSVEYLLGAPEAESPAAGVVQLRYRWGVWWAAEDCWLEDLYVRDSARGTGLGRALTVAALDRARARGCRRVELDVNTENTPALRLYESLGFTTGKLGGQDLLMRRHLDG
jgi:ribosomal protein S18 acetylase RimI-like enzyme